MQFSSSSPFSRHSNDLVEFNFKVLLLIGADLSSANPCKAASLTNSQIGATAHPAGKKTKKREQRGLESRSGGRDVKGLYWWVEVHDDRCKVEGRNTEELNFLL